MKNYIIVIVLSVVLFSSGFFAGGHVEKNSVIEEAKLLYEYATLLEQENMKVYKILYECCRK